MTFSLKEKQRILSSFKKNLADQKGINSEIEDKSPGELLKILNELPKMDFNRIVNNCLLENVVSFKANVLSLRVWRRRIKEWILSTDKPETRGHLLLPQENFDLFKQHLIPELQKMPSRNLITLRKILSHLFKKIDFPVSYCSRHWWYTFIDKNPDIKRIWESLPRRIKISNLSAHSNSVSDPFEEMESEIETGLSSQGRSSIQEEGGVIFVEQFSFTEEYTKEEREDMLIEVDESPIKKDEEFEMRFSGVLDQTRNSHMFQHEIMNGELEEWREWRSSLDRELEEEPLLKCLQLEPVQVTSRDLFFQDKEDIISLFEAALEMEKIQL